ncbi:MAG: hypothetical protein ACRD3E_19560, partial [Terriglobales bacterium]
MSAKILPFRSPHRPGPDEPAKFVSCPFCSFFTDKKWEIDRHMNADHARAMEMYGYKKDTDRQSS